MQPTQKTSKFSAQVIPGTDPSGTVNTSDMQTADPATSTTSNHDNTQPMRSSTPRPHERAAIHDSQSETPDRKPRLTMPGAPRKPNYSNDLVPRDLGPAPENFQRGLSAPASHRKLRMALGLEKDEGEEEGSAAMNCKEASAADQEMPYVKADESQMKGVLGDAFEDKTG